MTEMRQRLARCFLLVFPDLREPEVYLASTSSLANWDSMSMLVLTTVIEEEFQLQVDYEDLPTLTSFELILDYLKRKTDVSS